MLGSVWYFSCFKSDLIIVLVNIEALIGKNKIIQVRLSGEALRCFFNNKKLLNSFDLFFSSILFTAEIASLIAHPSMR